MTITSERIERPALASGNPDLQDLFRNTLQRVWQGIAPLFRTKDLRLLNDHLLRDIGLTKSDLGILWQDQVPGDGLDLEIRRWL